MATTGIVNGTAIAIYVGGTKVANLISNDFNLSMATRETTNKDTSGWETSLGGLKSWECTAEGMFAEDASYGYNDLYAVFIAGTAVTIMTSSQVSGDNKYTGQALLTKLDRAHGLEDNTTFTCSFKGTGAPTKAVI